MKHMVDVKIFYVFPGDHIDPGVPIGIKAAKRSELFPLRFGKPGKIFEDNVGRLHRIRSGPFYS
jgi:hypothetical protein